MITAWSFSRYSDYKTCPAKAYYKHVKKLKEPPNKAMQRGSAIHKLAEDYALGDLPRLPVELMQFSSEFTRLKNQKLKHIEEQWAFATDWTETGWFDADAWCRIKLDAAYINTKHDVLVVIDHKTGSMREERKADYMEQLELYALAGLLKFPNIAAVSPRLWYIDHGAVYPDPAEEELEFTHDDTGRLIKLWAARTSKMLTDTKFAPTPNHTCQWCHFRKANGGPCKF